MFCNKCGKENENDSKFCYNCGHNLNSTNVNQEKKTENINVEVKQEEKVNNNTETKQETKVENTNTEIKQDKNSDIISKNLLEKIKFLNDKTVLIGLIGAIILCVVGIILWIWNFFYKVGIDSIFPVLTVIPLIILFIIRMVQKEKTNSKLLLIFNIIFVSLFGLAVLWKLIFFGIDFIDYIVRTSKYIYYSFSIVTIFMYIFRFLYIVANVLLIIYFIMTLCTKKRNLKIFNNNIFLGVFLLALLLSVIYCGFWFFAYITLVKVIMLFFILLTIVGEVMLVPYFYNAYYEVLSFKKENVNK